MEGAGCAGAKLELAFSGAVFERGRAEKVVHECDSNLPGQVVITGRGHGDGPVVPWRCSAQSVEHREDLA
jgi:hypothetical protein